MLKSIKKELSKSKKEGVLTMATWQEINQMWAAVKELYGGLSASTAMPGWKMDVQSGLEMS